MSGELGDALDEMRLVFDRLEEQFFELNTGVSAAVAMQDGRSFVFQKIGSEWKFAVISIDLVVRTLQESSKADRVECAHLVEKLFLAMREQETKEIRAARQALKSLREFSQTLDAIRE